VDDLRGSLVGGRYLVDRLIGQGGLGSTIWSAVRSSSGERFAIKVLATARAEDVGRFERGTRLAMSLEHPCITRVMDYGSTADGALYQVMELLEGRTLYAHLGESACAPDEAMNIVDQILAALEVAHAQHVIHRDIKPSNVFVLREPHERTSIKVLDFGLAKLDPDAAAAEQLALVNEITQQQKICGTPEYMAPEQIVGAELDVRTDLYSVGVLAYRLLTGRLPFSNAVRHELYQAHLMTPPPPFDAALGLPRALETVVMKSLAKRPEDRFASAAELRTELFAVGAAEMKRIEHAVALFGARAAAGATIEMEAPAFDAGHAEPPVQVVVEPTPVASVAPRARPLRRWLWAACVLVGLGGATWVLADNLRDDGEQTPRAALEPAP